MIKIFREKWGIARTVLHKRGLLKGIAICGIYFLYNLHKNYLFKRVKKREKASTKEIELFNGKRFYCSLNDSGLSFDILQSKIREPYATKKLIDICESNTLGTFIDFGSNMGYYTVILGDYFNHIVCIEPNRKAINIFNKNIHHNNLAHKSQLIEGAVHYKNADLYMIERPDVNLSEVSEEKGDYKIASCKFDDVIRQYRPDFFKMDIEGFEFDIFPKLEESLLSIKDLFPKYIFIEVHHEKKTFTENKELFNLFEKLGYKINSAIWEEKGPYYLRNQSVLWRFLNKILVHLFIKDPMIASNVEILEYSKRNKDVLCGKYGAIEYILEKR